ncbi:carbohydrate ABC transporter permease [Tessaracoccus palaemonis]|uniref:Carbohydrate ABC transporter permease n=1 Tax=Tessaracoccus palaemonis TaxID=2829499 RepID=A0ABX8SHN2_9ACTN|nr:carbohydrate ABC transporter permease [Tessaracoccus palaemonis]QXT61638.1 carbohydrate ABC transporter permease [Tessaracoccus palaemonis]
MARTAAGNAARAISSPWASVVAVLLAVAWTTPTLGLLITSFRTQEDIQTTGWWTAFTNPWFTMRNYQEALFGGSTSLIDYFINSIVITIPAVIIPLLLAALASYAIAWTKFPGRDWLFVGIFALQIVPLQVALIPLQQVYNVLELTPFWRVWLSHSIFALPLAVFLLHNFMKDLPADLMEAARVDGAGHNQIFFRIILPLMKPALASFGIFQFLWVWNDLLVALIFAPSRQYAPLTVRVAEMSGTLGGQWYLLSAGAFISMIVPVIVFLSLQKYFVRGLLAGGLKG